MSAKDPVSVSHLPPRSQYNQDYASRGSGTHGPRLDDGRVIEDGFCMKGSKNDALNSTSVGK